MDNNGVVISGMDGVEKKFVTYYGQLFGGTDMPKNMTAARDRLRCAPELLQGVKECIEEPITLAEIDRAIGELAAHKTPGPDGLGAVLPGYSGPTLLFLTWGHTGSVRAEVITGLVCTIAQDTDT